LEYFYEKLSPYDKALQGLILGTIALAISSFISETPYTVLSDVEKLLEFSTIYNLISTEIITVIYMVAFMLIIERVGKWFFRKLR